MVSIKMKANYKKAKCMNLQLLEISKTKRKICFKIIFIFKHSVIYLLLLSFLTITLIINFILFLKINLIRFIPLIKMLFNQNNP